MQSPHLKGLRVLLASAKTGELRSRPTMKAAGSRPSWK